MPTLADVIAQQVGEAVSKAIADSKGELTDIAVAGGDAASQGLLGDVGTVVDILSNLLGDIPLIGGILSDITDPIKPLEDAGGKFGRGFGLGYVIGYLGFQMLSPILLPVIHSINGSTTNVIFDPETAAMLASKRIITTDFAHSEASGGGLDNPHTDSLIDAAQPRPGLPELSALWNRGIIAEADVDTALQRNGVPDFWIGPLKDLARQLVSPADLALAFLRGDIDQPTLYAYGARLGFAETDMDLFVTNTGEPPGLMQLLEAFRRDFIDKARLERGIKQSRVRDEWIDVVEDLRYSPMPIADAITAAVRNYISTDEARAIADQNGLIPDQFDTLLASHGRPIADGEALELLNRGQMTPAQVAQSIRESDIKDEYVPYVLELARRLIPYRTINTILSHGVRSKDWGVQYLMTLGYTADDADALVSTATAAKVVQTKQITEAQVVSLYESRGIDKADATKMLGNIGYDPTESEYILDAADSRSSLAEQNRAIAGIRAAFLADRIDANDAAQQLAAIGVLAAQSDKLVTDWKLELQGTVKTLSASQIAAAVYYGIWEYAYAERKLVALGYSEDDAKVLLDIRLHGAPSGTPAPGDQG